MAGSYSYSQRLRSVLGLLLFGATCHSGCSVAEYDRAYAKRVAEYRDSAMFAILDREPAILGELITIRFPRGYERIATNLETPAATGIRPDWLGGFGAIQTMSYGPDSTPDANARSMLFVITASEKTSVLEERIESRLRQQPNLQNEVFVWQPEEVSPVAGGPLVWRTLTIMHDEKLPPAGSVERSPTKLSVDCSFWVSADKEQSVTVVLVWLMPHGVTSASGVPPRELRSLVARTIGIITTTPKEGDEVVPL